jgi:hypothetical protein
MLLEQIANNLGLKPANEANSKVEVIAGYASDLLSDVLAKCRSGVLWVTNQKHQNVIGVSVMLSLAGVIIAGGIAPDENTIEKAVEEGVPLYTTELSLYEVVGRLYEMGIPSC